MMWIDDSICSTRFSVDRVFIPIAEDRQGDDIFDYSNRIRARQNSATNPTNGQNLLSAVSVVTDYLGESSVCGKLFGPMQIDTVDQKNLPLGAKVTYCVASSDPILVYTSGYSCSTQIYGSGISSPQVPSFVFSGILWDSSIKVSVNVGRHVTFSPASNIEIAWRVFSAKTDTEILAVAGSEQSMQIDYTDFNGDLTINFQASAESYPLLLEDSNLVFKLVPFKRDEYFDEFDQGVSFEHEFVCHDPWRMCTNGDPLIVQVPHNSRNEITRQIREFEFIRFSHHTP
jgi:hypothetical protein